MGCSEKFHILGVIVQTLGTSYRSRSRHHYSGIFITVTESSKLTNEYASCSPGIRNPNQISNPISYRSLPDVGWSTDIRS